MEITWSPAAFVPSPARLGLSCIPGKSRLPGSAVQDLDSIAQQGVSHVLSLVEEKELLSLNPPETYAQRRAAVEERGIGFSHQPIVDFEAPSLREARALVAHIDELLAGEHAVLIHCWAGLGRAGTLAACFLVQRRLCAREAIAEMALDTAPLDPIQRARRADLCLRPRSSSLRSRRHKRTRTPGRPCLSLRECPRWKSGVFVQGTAQLH